MASTRVTITAAGKPSSDRRYYKALWAIHSWTGLYLGLIVAILSVSGSAVVLKDEIDAVLNPSLLRVPPTDGRASVTAITDRIVGRHGARFDINTVRLPEDEGNVIQVDLIRLLGGGRYETRQVLVNPHNGATLGERDYNKTLTFYLRHLHVRGFQARYGRQFVGLFGIALLVSTVTGFLIYGNFMRSTTFGRIRWGQGLRIVSADWHKLVGISALLFNLVIAITGIWLGWSVEALNLAKKQPEGGVPLVLSKAKRIITPKEDAAMRVDYDSVLAAARRAFPGFEPQSMFPTRDGRRQVLLLGKPAGAIYQDGTDKVLVDKATHSVTAVFDVGKAGATSKLYYVAEPLHFGGFGGIALKLVYCLFGLTAGMLSITGFLIYWKRNESSGADERPRPTTMSRLIRWSAGVGSIFAVMAVVSVTAGPLYPSIATSVFTALWFLWLIGRFLFRAWRGMRDRRAA